MHQRELLELVGDIYTAATEPDRWPVVLETISDMHGGAGVMMGRINRAALCDNMVCCRWPTESIEAFQSQFGLANPGNFVRAVPSVALGHPITPEDVDGEEGYLASPQYATLGRQYGHRYWITALLYREPGWASFINVVRSEDKGPYNVGERDRLAMLSHHLGRAVALRHTFLANRATGILLADIVDRFDRGAVMVDAAGRIRFANRMARAIFERGDGIVATGERLAARSARETIMLLKRISEAAATSARMGIASSGPLRISRQDGARDYAVVVSPLSTDMLEGIADRALALVLIADPERRVPDASVIAALHGLTAAEARLATRLLLDDTAAEAAQVLGVTITTVRFHVRNMLAKTGARRQAELISILRDAHPG